jgi:hypothetical protein
LASNAPFSWSEVKETCAAALAVAVPVGCVAADWLGLADPPQPLTAAAPIKASAVVASAGPRRMGWGQ